MTCAAFSLRLRASAEGKRGSHPEGLEAIFLLQAQVGAAADSCASKITQTQRRWLQMTLPLQQLVVFTFLLCFCRKSISYHKKAPFYCWMSDNQSDPTQIVQLCTCTGWCLAPGRAINSLYPRCLLSLFYRPLRRYYCMSPPYKWLMITCGWREGE